MAHTLHFACRCGAVRASARKVSARTVMHGVCYCDDCQAWAHFLDRRDMLDAHGGTELVQLPPARLRFEAGAEKLGCVRLTGKGMHRWFTTCCNTPVGNTQGPRMPFVGIPLVFLQRERLEAPLDSVIGPPMRAQGRFAVGGPPPGTPDTVTLPTLLRTVRRLATWWLRREARPSPFFDAKTGEPVATPRVLTPAERDALPKGVPARA